MNAMKQIILTGWNFMRGFRLIVGLFFLIWGIFKSDTLLILGGVFFLITAIANAGCCGSGGCAVPSKKNSGQEIEEITYEEVKSN